MCGRRVDKLLMLFQKNRMAFYVAWLCKQTRWCSNRCPHSSPRGQKTAYFDSQHLKELGKFKENTSNFIIWPDDPISSYDLMELANVCLGVWSSGTRSGKTPNTGSSYTEICLSRRRFYTSCYNAGRIHQKLMLCLIWNIHGNTLSKRCVLPLAHFYSFTRFGRKRFLLILRMTPWPRRLWRSKRYLSGKQDLIEYNINKWKILNRQFSGGRIWAMRQGVRYLDKISIHQM